MGSLRIFRDVSSRIPWNPSAWTCASASEEIPLPATEKLTGAYVSSVSSSTSAAESRFRKPPNSPISRSRRIRSPGSWNLDSKGYRICFLSHPPPPLYPSPPLLSHYSFWTFKYHFKYIKHISQYSIVNVNTLFFFLNNIFSIEESTYLNYYLLIYFWCLKLTSKISKNDFVFF